MIIAFFIDVFYILFEKKKSLTISKTIQCSIQKFHFTKAFIGTNGISVQAGYTTPDVDEALVKTEAIKHSFLTYILADHSKFGVVSSVTFSDIKECCIITDTEPDKKYSDQTIIKAVASI